MSVPQVSVIMAVYNGGKYLRTAINSVLQQSFTEFEFIIVDDCSTDSTATIISSYRDGRIKYIKNKVNLGQTPSLNIALDLSKGKYIARIDADDVYQPEKLEIQYSFMEKHPEVTVCGTSGESIDENGEIYANRSFPQKPIDIYFRMFYHSPLNHVSIIMRRSIILKIGGYDERYPICADFALWSKLIKNNYQITNIPESLTQFRVHVHSLSIVNKLGQSGEEMADIIYSNIRDLLNLNITKNECRNIVLMLWPSSGVSIIDLSNAYLNLIAIAKKVYSTKMPIRVIVNLNKYYLKSLVKRSLYFKSQKKFGLVSKELLNVFRVYYLNPVLIFIAIISFLIVLFLSEKIINRLKLVFLV